MSQIVKVDAREILDSRGNPTIETDVILDNGKMGRFSVPSGASTGKHEALELRDNDTSRYLGKSVENAIKNVEEVIQTTILGMETGKQAELDSKLLALDGTENKSKLGANAILSVSAAYAEASAAANDQDLYQYLNILAGQVGLVGKSSAPSPMFNIMNGGKHASWATDVQEYMIIVHNRDFPGMVQAASEIFITLGELISQKGMSTNVGNEGGYAPGFASNEEAFGYMLTAIERCGFKPGEDITLAIDVAASEFFFEDGSYNLKTENRKLSAEEWHDVLAGWIEKYPLTSIEDPFAEDDWTNWSKFTEKYGSKLQIVGDDLLVTNVERVEKGIELKACNSLLVKLNQIGTLSETLRAMKISQDAGWTNIISHRSGETEDTFIAHLAVGTGCGQIKTGAPSRGERTAKYNEIIRINEKLALNA
jgi:enolase